MNGVQKLRDELKKQQVDAILISAVPNIIYLTGYSAFKTEERDGFLLITSFGQYILTHALYAEAVEKEVAHFKLLEFTPENPLREILEDLRVRNKINTLGVEEYNLNVLEYKYFKKIFKKLKGVNLSKFRNIKSHQEIEKIKKACEYTDQAFDFMLSKLDKDISEEELAFEMEIFLKTKRVNLAFETIVAFGKNSSVPHHQTGNTIIKRVESGFLLFDFGAKFENYCADMSRTVFLGKPTMEQKKLYQTVLEGQQKCVESINTSLSKGRKILGKDIEMSARDYIKSMGFPDFPHSGHGIGLEVHEGPSLSPKSKQVIEEGMVFSIEPGIYIPGFGGVRIEDLYTIQNGKLVQLTKSSKELITI